MKRISIVLLIILALSSCRQGSNNAPIDEPLVETPLSPTPTFTPLPISTPLSEGSGKIAFVSNKNGDSEIFIINADGSGLQQLTDNDWADGDPSWSPDGSMIVFYSKQDGDNEIYIINADGSGIQQLTDNDWDDYDPVWSP